jgi:hypothetical protein
VDKISKERLRAIHFGKWPVWFAPKGEMLISPWTGDLPVGLKVSRGWDFFTRARATLADGTEVDACAAPGSVRALEQRAIEEMNPHLLLPRNGGIVALWWAREPLPTPQQRDVIYRALRRKPNQVFPIRFVSDPSLVRGRRGLTVDGFCTIANVDVTRWKR